MSLGALFIFLSPHFSLSLHPMYLSSESMPGFLDLSHCTFSLVCQCVSCERDLGGSSSGAEVRIRSNQLYCNDCYLRFKCKRANQRENFLSFEETTGSYAFSWACSHLFLRFTTIGSWVSGVIHSLSHSKKGCSESQLPRRRLWVGGTEGACTQKLGHCLWFAKIQKKLLMTPGLRIGVKTSLLSD